VFDYGTGETNSLDVGFDGSTFADVSWAGSAPQPRDVSAPLALGRPSDVLVMRVAARGQPHLVVDQLEIFPGACV
jgi:hypothetical protein